MGVRSLKSQNFIVSRWALEGHGREQKIAFVVSSSRGYEEYRKVKQQNTKPTYSLYSKSLLNSMFKKWR